MTEQEFLDGLTTQQATFFNARLVSIRSEFQATYQASVAELVSVHKTALSEIQTELDASNALVKSLQERLLKLFTELPFDPRIIDATAFYERITKDEFAALSVSDDETLRTIAKTILTYKTNDWPVIFESPEFQGLIGYLVGTGFLSEDRAKQLTADANRAEAYDAS